MPRLGWLDLGAALATVGVTAFGAAAGVIGFAGFGAAGAVDFGAAGGAGIGATGAAGFAALTECFVFAVFFAAFGRRTAFLTALRPGAAFFAVLRRLAVFFAVLRPLADFFAAFLVVFFAAFRRAFAVLRRVTTFTAFLVDFFAAFLRAFLERVLPRFAAFFAMSSPLWLEARSYHRGMRLVIAAAAIRAPNPWRCRATSARRELRTASKKTAYPGRNEPCWSIGKERRGGAFLRAADEGRFLDRLGLAGLPE